MAFEPDIGLSQTQRLAEGDEDLLPNQVDASDRLGDGMLDLHPRIDLKEPYVSLVDVIEKLNRSETLVLQPVGDPERIGMQLRSIIRV